MKCKAPSFWWKSPGLAAHALRPAAKIYNAIATRRQQSITPYTAEIPILCIGNAVAGGSGKTPTVQALTTLLFEQGVTRFPAILLRGYGGNLRGPTTVDLKFHTYKDVGDEALLHAGVAPAIIARDRAAGAKLAQLSGADMIIMDDGLQNPSLAKTLSFLMVDEAQGIGNGLTLPAGPLREKLDATLDKTDAIILAGERLPFDSDRPVFRAKIEPAGSIDTALAFVAFAGLGRPDKFRRTLETLGASIAAFHEFADHYAYTSADIEKLVAEAEEKNAVLITTEKDFMRVPEQYRDRVQYLPVKMVFDDPQSLVGFIRERLAP